MIGGILASATGTKFLAIQSLDVYDSFMLSKRVGRADETGAALCEGLICSKPFLLLFLAKKSRNK